MVTRRHHLALAVLLLTSACEEPWATEDLAALDPPVAFASVSVGAERSCGLDGDGRAWCWGTDASSPTMRELCFVPAVFPLPEAWVSCWKRPAPVAGGHRFALLRHGGVGNQTWAIDLEGRLWGWGSNRYRVLHQGDEAASITRVAPVGMFADKRFIAVDGSTTMACAVTTGGELWCWGQPNMVTTGVPLANTICPPGSPASCAVAPFRVGTATDWVDVGVGTEHACALTTSGRIWCWGMGYFGELGIASTPMCNVGGFNFRCLAAPTLVTAALTFDRISSEGNETCGITTGNALHCWGLLAGSTGTTTPLLVGSGYAQVEVSGRPGKCAVRLDGTVWCTGVIGLAGALAQVPVVGPFVGAVAATDHACAWNASGEVFCFGDKTYGQLGDGISEPVFGPTPYQVAPPFKY